jgi:nitrogen fixation-related uncharacterized protein
MCPNCVLNQASLAQGMYVAFGVCALFFIVGVAAMLWAFRNGEFENMEDSKFEMLDDVPNSELIQRARAASEQTRKMSIPSEGG